MQLPSDSVYQVCTKEVKFCVHGGSVPLVFHRHIENFPNLKNGHNLKAFLIPDILGKDHLAFVELL